MLDVNIENHCCLDVELVPGGEPKVLIVKDESFFF